ncbi:trypsin-like serine protease [Streptomyces sudanensis]|uniref:trypsin-like serine protease n=1 Tax=Streptomyces sudanensis TaxID=436397 RepID=UPI0020CCCDF7|nr:trypsin-like serine protease [Streptomyces sudanensis]MCP9958962.1 trypsin-like serine protease [Streptomyces sudanensis]MCQ0000563.1 trypsin-like serine protease [Streptomyces sudanensis]
MGSFGRFLPAFTAALALSAGVLGAAPAHAVVGGDEVGGDGDWMVQVHVTLRDGTKRVCGGAAVGQWRNVLTSAGCVAGAEDIRLAAGLSRLATKEDEPPKWDQPVSVAEGRVTWTHPGYDSATGRNDVAVVRTPAGLNIRGRLPLATSDDTASYAPGTLATLRGWGSTSGASREPAPSVREVTLPIRPDGDCATAMGAAWAPGRMVCAGEAATGDDAGTVAPCTGDEGGPLVVRGRLVGIYSRATGPGCTAEGSRAVFTKVSAFVGEINPWIFGASLSGDTRADLFAMTPDGKRHHHHSTGSGLGSPPVGLPTLERPYTRFRQADLDSDGEQDYVFRTAGGDLYWGHYVVTDSDEWGFPVNRDWYETKLGSGWNAMRSITVPGDLTGDGHPDIVAVDQAGDQWLYPFKPPYGGLLPRIRTGTGWGSLTVFGSGDYTGDGKADLITRDTAGRLWLYRGTGIAATPWRNPVRIGTGWNYTAYAASGDATGDGRADFFVRDSAGYLWLYKGTGNLAAPLQNRVKVGSGWNAYSLIG